MRHSDADQALLDESNSYKAEANVMFASSRYSEAIGEYDKALASCPNYLEFQIAVLKSNVSACHLKLAEWKAAIDSATSALDAIDRLILEENESKDSDAQEEGDSRIVEVGDEESDAFAKMDKMEERRQQLDNMNRIKVKSLLRRARARMESGGWGNLQGAEEDYKAAAQFQSLPVQDRKVVQKALAELPPRIQEAKDKEMGDMLGKLKEVGNGLLKPFGLSTDMFNMVKDEKTGGYSMNINQGG